MRLVIFSEGVLLQTFKILESFPASFPAFRFRKTIIKQLYKGVGNLVRADLCLDFLKRTKLLSLSKRARQLKEAPPLLRYVLAAPLSVLCLLYVGESRDGTLHCTVKS